ncbi:hypothetical protein E0Z10_g11008 [Xylaria hypoxylon]|uniref:Uncharacterized protein n=1 Tax=Xylaria hypoxylon TaxID=37992 RepID=A0A4Z0YE71_9PEZI|nr:hypothetical protein E0Z10_g11008 [Xylaria hypoxylon]
MVSPNALVNPYDVEFSTMHVDRNSNTYTNVTETDTATANSTTDDDTGGWLANHKRAHQRAIAQYLTATAAAAEKYPSHHSGAKGEHVELARMATETGTCGGDSAVAVVSVASGVACSDGPVAPPDSECLPKASFLERYLKSECVLMGNPDRSCASILLDTYPAVGAVAKDMFANSYPEVSGLAAGDCAPGNYAISSAVTLKYDIAAERALYDNYHVNVAKYSELDTTPYLRHEGYATAGSRLFLSTPPLILTDLTVRRTI